nr:Fic family protein [Hymenobacter profundi]
MVIRGRFDTLHFCQIHAFVLQDLYSWAGQTRHEVKSNRGPAIFDYPQRITGPDTFPFAAATTVHHELDRISVAWKQENGLRGLAQDEFVQRLATYCDHYDHVAPFQAGNAAVLLLVIEQLAQHAGYTVQFAETVVDQAGVNSWLTSMKDRNDWAQVLASVTTPAPGLEAEIARRPSLREEPVLVPRVRHQLADSWELKQVGAFFS